MKKNTPKTPEILRPIPGLEGRYSASADGRIWAHRRKHFRKASLQRTGYLTITINDKYQGHRTVPVHRLVACAWVPNPDGLPQVNHRDGRKTNNSHTNLEWCTNADNGKHAWATGLTRMTTKMSAALHAGRQQRHANR